MWTPKRILLLLSGFVAFIAAYSMYAFWLGGIDGLPPLPRDFEPVDGSIETFADTVRPTPEADRRLELAFGPSWREDLQCKIRVEMRAKNLVLATNDFNAKQPDGRVLIAPFNVAIFGKEEPGRPPEINTIRSKVALLTFERPITNISDMGRHKLVACELRGGGEEEPIRIRNNRRTVKADDDISLMTQGPLFYHEDKHLIQTPAAVRLVDEQTKPEQSTITATGMELRLTTEPEAKPGQSIPPPRPKKNQSISGVESIHLLSTVDMYLWVESSGFLGGNADKPVKPGEAPAEIPKLHISTQGPFHYYVSADEEKAPDRAVFELPAQPGQLPEKVTVTRVAGPKTHEKRDQLQCDRLELTFRRRADGTGPREGSSVNLAIQDAHATGRPVVLHSDTDLLDAIGNDFFYNARTKLSVLKGDKDKEMWANKDGHEVFARELEIDTSQKNVHQARARGPGRINMLDRATGKRNLHARWSEGLDFNKEGVYDCLTLRGEALFEDKENLQQLQADTLKVWLLPAERDAPAGSEAHKLRPHHLKAAGNVRVHSAELRVGQGTENLTIWFKDVAARPPASDSAASSASSSAGTPAGPKHSGPSVGAKPDAGAVAQPSASAPTRGLIPTSSSDKNKKPLELSARSVVTHVLRLGDRNELERVTCDGAVHVHQEPATPEDKGIDIRGDSLTLNHFIEGSILVVTGSVAQLAVVQLNKMTIRGLEVNIDQKSNTAWVNGMGAMQMLTEKDFEGEKLREPTELTVYWQRTMFFEGQNAVFEGRVQARQNNSTLLCEQLQAFLDRRVSFKEGEKRGQSASVQKMVCDKNVRIDEEKREGIKLVRKTRLASPSVLTNKEDNILEASGPGVLHMLQLGEKDETLGGPRAQKNNAAKEKELTLTRIMFRDKLYGNNQSRLAIFYGAIDVVHVPTDNIDVPLDVDKPLPDMLHLQCERRLKVLSHRHSDGRTTQEMEAEHKVYVEAQEFWGRGEILKYDESKQQVILEGGERGVATLYRTKGPGGVPDTFKARKITYNRRTNEIDAPDSTGIKITQ